MLVALAIATAVGVAGCRASIGNHAPGEHRIFDERADGEALLAAALARARAEDKQVFLFFGANWCPYCRKLHALLRDDPALREIVAASFVVVPIDVGSSGSNRNTALIDRYDAPVFTTGTPAVVILDGEGARVAPAEDNPWPASNWSKAGRLLGYLERAAKRGAQKRTAVDVMSS